MMRMFKMTAGGIAAAGLLLAAACASESDGEAGEGDQADRVQVDRVEIDLPVSEPLMAFGDVLLAAVEGEAPNGSDRVDVRYSDDLGATWTPCPENEPVGTVCGVAVDPAEDQEVAGSLAVSGDEVSLDGGRTWRSPIIEPDLGPDTSRPRLKGPVELAGGGWLAVGRAHETGDQSQGLVVRSDDGVHWQQLLDPDPCREDDATEGRPNSSVSAPLAVGDQWLVWYSCSGLVDRLWSRLYLLEADGTGLTELSDDLDSKGDYGPPVVVGDVVVLPELEGDRMGALIRLR